MAGFIAEYFKNELKALMPIFCESVLGVHLDTEKAFMEGFDNPVNLYIKGKSVGKLEELLADENVTHFMKYWRFATRMPAR